MRHESGSQIDVIIPVYRPDEKFRRLLQGLHSQTLRPARIILMNTGEEYWREEWRAGVPETEVYHLEQSEFDHAGTRNRAAELSSAEYMLFMTQDAVPANERLLEELYLALQDKQAAAAYARQLPNPDCNPIDAYTRGFNYPKESRKKLREDIETMGIKAFFCSDVCAMYRAEDFRALGGFPARAIFNEDMIFARKALEAGRAVIYKAEAQVYHSHNYSCMQQLRRNFDLAVSQRQNPQTFGGIASESEGIRMVAGAARHLMDTGKWYLLPKLILGSAAKYTGYLLGKHYERLPGSIILRLTGTKSYWGPIGRR